MLEHSARFQDAAQQLNLSPETPEPAHVHRLEAIMAQHSVGDSLTTPAATNRHIIHHLFHEKKNCQYCNT
jgi:acyl-CoA-binding protein